ncbi:MAG: polymerase sigma-70 factor, subfamily [Frankiales bacterium]|nr:polymerase sigma-70 factor, subfamily [Frankiales bacterium]
MTTPTPGPAIPPALEDARDFEAWLAPYLPTLRRVAVRLARQDGDDVVQSAIERAWRHRRQFDGSRGSAQSWLVSITVHEAHRQRRPPAPTLATEDRVDDRYPDVDLERAIRRLSTRQGLAVDLYYFVDLSVDDVAAAMGVSTGTVKSTLADARKRLAAILKVTDDD